MPTDSSQFAFAHSTAKRERYDCLSLGIRREQRQHARNLFDRVGLRLTASGQAIRELGCRRILF